MELFPPKATKEPVDNVRDIYDRSFTERFRAKIGIGVDFALKVKVKVKGLRLTSLFGLRLAKLQQHLLN